MRRGSTCTGTNASQRRWQEQAGVQPPACYNNNNNNNNRIQRRCSRFFAISSQRRELSQHVRSSGPGETVLVPAVARLASTSQAPALNRDMTRHSQTFAVGTSGAPFLPLHTSPLARARMHHKVVGNFGSEADVQSLYFRGFRFNETSDNGACAHSQPAK